MPRIHDGFNNALDFCRKCFPKTEALALQRFGAGEGPDGRGNCFSYDSEHPAYEGLGYRCTGCDRPLGDADD
jgi:hypothetical protein